MGRNINGVTADVLVCFQTRPGVDTDSIIEAGDAEVKTVEGQKTVKPLEGDGKKAFYSLKLENGAATELTIFNTTYTVKNEHKTKCNSVV